MKYIDPSSSHTGIDHRNRPQCLPGEFSIAKPDTNVRNIPTTLGLGPAGTMSSHLSSRAAKAGELASKVNNASRMANAEITTTMITIPVARDIEAEP